MEDQTGTQDSAGTPVPTETAIAADLHTAEGRRGPTWRGWILSILVAIILSVMATLLLGGSGAFRSDRAVTAESAGSGYRGNCCPPAGAGK